MPSFNPSIHLPHMLRIPPPPQEKMKNKKNKTPGYFQVFPSVWVSQSLKAISFVRSVPFSWSVGQVSKPLPGCDQCQFQSLIQSINQSINRITRILPQLPNHEHFRATHSVCRALLLLQLQPCP